jgi:cyclophilin family peptidyl-prolyl cis-trans isomerase
MKWVIVIALLVAVVGSADLGAQAARGRARGAASTLPVVVFQTSKGSFEMELYPAEAPKSVEHILTLVRRGFYKGQRVHRFVEGFVVQFGDPQSRDVTKKDRWGSMGSGRSIGVAEISPKRPHKLGAVGLAHSGDPKGADSQIYVCLNGPARYAPPNAALDGNYAVIGQVTSGMDVVQKLRALDVIQQATVKEPGRGAK